MIVDQRRAIALGLIGVELYRLHVGSVSATNFVFAAYKPIGGISRGIHSLTIPVRTTSLDCVGGRKTTGQPTITEPVLGRPNTNSVESFCMRLERCASMV